MRHDTLQGYSGTMIPTDEGPSLRALVQAALYNIDQFDKVPLDPIHAKGGADLRNPKTHRQMFEDGLAAVALRRGWSVAGCEEVKKLKKRCPPNALYRIKGGYASQTRGLTPLGLIGGYRPGQKGGPAEAVILVLGAKKGEAGSAEQPVLVPGEGLEDVTATARKGHLPELML